MPHLLQEVQQLFLQRMVLVKEYVKTYCDIIHGAHTSNEPIISNIETICTAISPEADVEEFIQANEEPFSIPVFEFEPYVKVWHNSFFF